MTEIEDTRIEDFVPAALDGERVDRVVSLIADCSRADSSRLIRAGDVRLNGTAVTKPSNRVIEGDLVELARKPVRETPAPEADDSVELSVIHSDDDIVVLNKSAGQVVHPGHGQATGTVVNGLLARYPEMASVGAVERPGIVHRLDKGTTGLLVAARTQEAHEALVEALSSHSIDRLYRAIVWGHPNHRHGIIDAPIGRSKRDPLRMTVVMDGREARTSYEVLEQFNDPVAASLVSCELETGRTHQIRVHMASIGHQVVGDITYGGARQTLDVGRPMLHAAALRFVHPATGEWMEFVAPDPPDFTAALARLS